MGHLPHVKLKTTVDKCIKSFNFVSKFAFSEVSFFCFYQHVFLIEENEDSNIRLMVSM